MRSNLVLTLIPCLILCSTVHAGLDDLKSVLTADTKLSETYGNICSSINGTGLSSLPMPTISLQKRIDLAEDNETITLECGRYIISEPINVTENITAIGDGLVVIDAERSGELLNISGSNLRVKIENIVFVNGEGDHGGAIDSNAKNLTLINCAFINNVANEGSGIYSKGTELAIFNSTFARNAAVDSVIFASRGKLRLENVTFRDNIAMDYCVAICCMNGLTPDYKDYQFKGIDADRHDGDFDTVVKNCAFQNNTARRQKVGGLNVCITPVSGKTLIKNSNFTSNSLGFASSTIFGNGCPLIISNCSTSSNKITVTGVSTGVLLTDGEALLENCKIAGNEWAIDNDRSPSC